MDRNAITIFCEQLRDARLEALADAEAFDSIIHVIERLGSFCTGKIGTLELYRLRLWSEANRSPLAEEIPTKWPDLHLSFRRLYELVQDARNYALHQGAFARMLTDHAIQLSIVMEDALRQSLENPVVSDFMVRSVTVAEDWQPISFIRQMMLSSSFSFLPVRRGPKWFLISDREIASFLRAMPAERRNRMAVTLGELGISLVETVPCSPDETLETALEILKSDPRALLVQRKTEGDSILVGILTPFDLL